MKLNNLKVYYLLILTNNLWFITSNWLNFWMKYMTLKEVSIIDAIAFLLGIMMEFPSGLISDRLGRKQTLLISQSLQLLGSLLITLSSSLIEIGFGFVIFQIGVAFYSGTIEAFGYESAIHESHDYSKLLVKSGVLTNFGYLFSLILGGYLYTLNNNWPNLLFTLNFLIGLVICWFCNEIPKKDVNHELKVSYQKFNFYIIAIFVLLMSLSFSFDYGFLKLFILEKFSNLNLNYWYIFVATSISLLVTSYLLSKIENYTKTLFLSLAIVLLGFAAMPYSFIPLFFVLSFLAVFIYQLSLKYINEKTADSNRAGIISLFNLFYKLPYVLIALYLGYNLG